jgi:hypothetical protein
LKTLAPILLSILLSTTAQAQTSRQINSGDITGALGYTPQQSLGFTPQQVVNVMDYGAKCDFGSTDDGPAFNAAIAYIRSLPEGNGGLLNIRLVSPSTSSCFIATTINLTNLHINGLTIDLGHIECATNGKPCIDALASSQILWERLNIWGQSTNSPSIGVQIGRISSSNADVHTFLRPHIEGWFSFANFYNFASEDLTMVSPFFKNWYTGGGTYWALVQDGCNHFNITSQYVTETVGVDQCQSFNSNVFLGPQFETRGTGGIPMFFADATNHKIIRGYACSACDGVGSPTVGAVIHTVNTGIAMNARLNLDVHFESAPTAAVLFSGNLAAPTVKGFSYDDHLGQETVSYLALDTAGAFGTSITNITINDLKINVAAVIATPRVFDNQTKYTINGGFIQIPAYSEWVEPAFFNGTLCAYSGLTPPCSTLTRFQGPTGEALQLIPGTGSTTAQILNPAGGAVFTAGSDTNSASVDGWSFHGVASPGATAYVTAAGPDSNIELHYFTKGTGIHKFGANGGDPNNGNHTLEIWGAAANVNKLAIQGGATGNPVQLNAVGSDTNIGIQLNPQGTGAVSLPSVATGTPTASLCIDASNRIIKKTTTGPCI